MAAALAMVRVDDLAHLVLIQADLETTPDRLVALCGVELDSAEPDARLADEAGPPCLACRDAIIAAAGRADGQSESGQ